MSAQEVVIWKLVDMALNAVAVGLERQAVIERVKVLETEGKSPDEIADAIKAMRDEALAKLG
jgi:hypothetical protein